LTVPYNPQQNNITFDEEVAFRTSRESHMEIDSEEQEALKDDHTDPFSPVVHPSDYQEESIEPTELVDLPRDAAMIRKRPTWLRDTLQDANGHASPNGTFRESKRPHKFSSYLALMSHIIDSEPSSYEEAGGQ
jgi:hypothetical protein